MRKWVYSLDVGWVRYGARIRALVPPTRLFVQTQEDLIQKRIATTDDNTAKTSVRFHSVNIGPVKYTLDRWAATDKTES